MIERYDCPEIRYIWSDENRFKIWEHLEIKFLENFTNIKINKEDYPEIDISSINEIEKRTKHDVAAFVEWLEKTMYAVVGKESRFIHYGLTSSDIVDTSFSIMLQLTNSKIADFLYQLRLSIEKHKNTNIEILARTHGQAAEKIFLSQKFQSYSNSVETMRYKLLKRQYFGKLSGSVGDNKYVSKAVTEKTLKEFGIINDCVEGQIVSRFVYAEIMNEWAIIASIIAKMATDIRLLSQTGIEEIFEGFDKNQIGSSSMPHKRNPVLCENICGLSRVIRGYQTTAMQNIELWNERDISHSSAERMIFPSAAVTLGFMINRMIEIFDNLFINDIKISNNIIDQNRNITSQQEMLDLIKTGMTRKEAHDYIKTKGIR